jgi:hypothetical protein
MSRLVRAEDVKELLLGLDALPWEEQVDELVDAIPTAYDAEAVVRELEEELKYHVKGELRCEDKGYEAGAERHRQKVIAYDTAIAIVKRGGRND